MTDKNSYDQAYKLLFSEPRMVQDLLVGFFAEDWINELDFKTLKRVNSDYITETLRERDSDVVWKVQWQEQSLYVLILVEFQSSIDPFMVVRVLSYLSLLYLDIIKEDKDIRINKQLPPVLPLVLYNGAKLWNAPLSFEKLLSPHLPKTLRKYQPDFTFWLLEEGRCIINSEFLESGNLIAPLIELEQSKQLSDALRIVNFLVQRLKGSEFDSIRRAFAVYLKRMLRFEKMLPDLQINQLHEVQQMLSERVDIWMQEATEKGMSKGLSQGVILGELAIVKYQLRKRFGSLSAAQELALKNKSADELLEISGRILDASSIDEAIIFSI